MLISTFQEFPTHLSPFFQSLGFKHLEQSEAVERLERLELAAASMSEQRLSSIGDASGYGDLHQEIGRV